VSRLRFTILGLILVILNLVEFMTLLFYEMDVVLVQFVVIAACFRLKIKWLYSLCGMAKSSS
jgi:hypothetical protein